MHRLVNGIRALAAVAAGLAIASAANAESRLFTVRASQPNVTITQAWQNGAQLPIGGRNGTDKIFRIDNPSGAVPCLNHLQFVGSNGGSVDTTADLCSSNWDLTVALASGASGVGIGSAPTAGQPVAIATDDPNVTITGVFLRGQPVPIVARHDPYVQIVAPSGPAGSECQRDLGLALSDGRQIARSVDICQSNDLVVIALVGGPLPPPPPASMQAVAQPPAQSPPVPAPSPYSPAPQAASAMTWLFASQGDNGTLSYGVANTDSSQFTATCASGSGNARVILSPTSDELGPRVRTTVRFTTGAFDNSYTATGGDVSAIDGLSHPVLQIAMNDPLWSAIISGDALTIFVGSSPGLDLSLSGSSAGTKRFLAFCNPPSVAQFPAGPAQPAAPSLPPSIPNGAPSQAIFACDDGSLLRVTFNAASVVVSEAGNAPVFLSSAGGQRWAAGLSQLTAQGPGVIWVRDGTYPRTCMPQ